MHFELLRASDLPVWARLPCLVLLVLVVVLNATALALAGVTLCGEWRRRRAEARRLAEAARRQLAGERARIERLWRPGP